MLKRVSVPLPAIDTALSLPPADMKAFLEALSLLAHDDSGSPPFPEQIANVWKDMPADISRQHRSARAHAQSGAKGGRPKKGTVKPPKEEFDDGMDAFTASMERPRQTDAAAYIMDSGFRMTPNHWEEFRDFSESGIPDDLIIWAVDKAADRSAGWSYVKAVLDRCITQDITTLEQAVEESEKYRAERSANGTAVQSGRMGEDAVRSAQKAFLEQYGSDPGSFL